MSNASTTIASHDREGFNEAVANMFSSPKYSSSYLLYAHILAQCKVIFDNTMQAPAGVNFQYDHFNLYINPTGVDLDPNNPNGPKDKNGNPITHIEGFNEFPLEQRLGILKHEMLHIILGHTHRREDRDHEAFNVAADCAINQLIERKHLPEWGIFPDQFPGGKTVPVNLTAEQYYELIDKQESNGDGRTLDDHSKWQESEGSKDLQKDIAKGIIERAIAETAKSKGNIPSQISYWLDLLSKKRELDWKTVLRNILGNKRVNTRKTIMKADRRMPKFEWLKGRTKDRKFDLLVISDVSGSVPDTALLSLWGEVRHTCDVTQSEVNLIQIDTKPSAPEKLTKNTKVINRKACGGTYLAPAIQKAKEHKIQFNAIVCTTDGYLDESDVKEFADLNVKVIWLISADGQIMPSMNNGLMQAFKLKS